MTAQTRARNFHQSSGEIKLGGRLIAAVTQANDFNDSQDGNKSESQMNKSHSSHAKP